MQEPHSPQDHRSLRLHAFDYASAGAYFVTVCTSRQRQLLGEVSGGEVRVSGAGGIASDEWRSLAKRFQGLLVDSFIIMPNHLHGILLFPDAPESFAPLGQVVRSFKSLSTRRIRNEGMKSFAWQRNFFDRIVRNEAELLILRRYVADNPQKWDLDRNNPGTRISTLRVERPDESGPYT